MVQYDHHNDARFGSSSSYHALLHNPITYNLLESHPKHSHQRKIPENLSLINFCPIKPVHIYLTLIEIITSQLYLLESHRWSVILSIHINCNRGYMIFGGVYELFFIFPSYNLCSLVSCHSK